MRFLDFLRSPAGRAMRMVVGTALVWLGASMNSLPGLLLMVLGLIPVVTGVTNVCLLDEVVREIARRRSTHGADAHGRHRA